MCGTYLISFLDKQTLNFSNSYGLQADTNMTGNDYSWVASALNFGWLLTAYPWNLALQRYPIGRLIGVMLFVWGSMCMLQAAVFDFGGFFAVRFFLGAPEAVVSPAFILLTSMFWEKEEQSLRSSFWLACNGFASIIGALLAYGSGHAEGLTIPNWKLIYLIAGCMTILWGVVVSQTLFGLNECSFYATDCHLPARRPTQRQDAHPLRESRLRLARLAQPYRPEIQRIKTHPDPRSPPRPQILAHLA